MKPNHWVARLATCVLVAVLMPGAVIAAEPNRPPVAVDDPDGTCGLMVGGVGFPIYEDRAEPFLLTGDCGPTANDVDPDGDPLTWEIVTQPEHGEAWWISDTAAAYLPDLDYSTNWPGLPGGTADSDRFTYRVSDGKAFSEPATFRFFVVPMNDAPRFDWLETVNVRQGESPYRVQWATNIDAGPFESYQTVSFVGDRGHTTGIPSAFPIVDDEGVLTFETADTESGWGDITLHAIDDGGLDEVPFGEELREVPTNRTPELTFRLNVIPNNAPEATSDTVMVAQGSGATSLPVLANDGDPDEDDLVITAVTQGGHGVVAIAPGGGSLTYDPIALYAGGDSFEYTVDDGHGGTDHGAVGVTVSPDATPPVITARTRGIPSQVAGSSTMKVQLGWTGLDVGSGIGSYRLEVSTNGSAYRDVPLATVRSTSVTLTLSLGTTYRFRVRARDHVGNTGAFSTWPSITPTRYQETSSTLRYTGTWLKATGSSLSGGSSRYTPWSSRRSILTFTARDVAWVATKRTNGGRAQVWIDGKFVQTVDLDATSTMYRRVVFSRDFASKGTHTMEIRPLGDGRVELDAILALR